MRQVLSRGLLTSEQLLMLESFFLSMGDFKAASLESNWHTMKEYERKGENFKRNKSIYSCFPPLQTGHIT